jgi:hypothetical protein
MARKTRSRRERRSSRSTPSAKHASAPDAEAPAPSKRASAAGASYAGARVARVAVDHETWEAFRALCGSKPASIRLGELVSEDVERARQDSAQGADALAAIRDIRDRAAELERFLRDT